MRVELTVFRLEGGRVIHCATRAIGPSRDRTEVKRFPHSDVIIMDESKPPVLTTRLMDHLCRRTHTSPAGGASILGRRFDHLLSESDTALYQSIVVKALNINPIARGIEDSLPAPLHIVPYLWIGSNRQLIKKLPIIRDRVL